MRMSSKYDGMKVIKNFTEAQLTSHTHRYIQSAYMKQQTRKKTMIYFNEKEYDFDLNCCSNGINVDKDLMVKGKQISQLFKALQIFSI